MLRRRQRREAIASERLNRKGRAEARLNCVVETDLKSCTKARRPETVEATIEIGRRGANQSAMER